MVMTMMMMMMMIWFIFNVHYFMLPILHLAVTATATILASEGLSQCRSHLCLVVLKKKQTTENVASVVGVVVAVVFINPKRRLL